MLLQAYENSNNQTGTVPRPGNRAHQRLEGTMMKLIMSVIAIVLLLLAGYHIRPDIEAAVSNYWGNRIDKLAENETLTTSQRHDSLIVISLDFRHEDRLDLARAALQKANALMPGMASDKGLLGLYDLESANKTGAIEAWRKGAEIAPDDPNLSYLGTLDTADLQYIDGHMLEKMFVDTLLNGRLKVPLYHQMDSDVIEDTTRKIRVEGAIDRTFVITGIAALLVLWWSISRILRIRRRHRAQKDASSDEAAHTESAVESGVSRPLHYMVMISSILKIGQVLAALFNYFMLGSDISGFVTDYVFTPSNLFSLFTENLMFAVIFVLIVGTEIVRKTMFSASAVKA